MTTFPMTYNSPVGLGVTLQVPTQCTTAVHLKLWCDHAEAVTYMIIITSWNRHKKMALKAVNSAYMFALYTIFTGCMGSSEKDIMNHIMARYRKLQQLILNRKKKTFRIPWTHHSKLVCYSRSLMMGYDMTVRQTHLFINLQVLKLAYHAMRYSLIYIYACKHWHRNPSVDNTWDKFKLFFALEYNELREEYNLNATQAGFQHADYKAEEEHDFASALNNLALALFSKCVRPVDCFEQNIDTVQQNPYSHRYKPDTEWNRGNGQSTQMFQEKQK